MKIVLCRHGETAWSLSGQHTGLTDLPLTQNGIQQAKILKSKLPAASWAAVYTSPLQRAKESCALAGFSGIIEPKAAEWNYGDYEGITSLEIAKKDPHWNLFTKGAPHGETPADVGKRADQLIAECLEQKGDVLIFSHGHFLRVFAVRWIGLDVACGRLFGLDVASVSILGFDKGQRVIRTWNS